LDSVSDLKTSINDIFILFFELGQQPFYKGSKIIKNEFNSSKS